MWLKPVISFVWAVGLLVIGWLNRRQRLEEERWVASLTERATGGITDIRTVVHRRKRTEWTMIVPTFRFEHEGQTFEVRSPREFNPGTLQLGERVPVRCSPLDPGGAAAIDKDLKPISLFGPQGYVIEWVLIGLGLLLAVAGVVAAIQAAFGIS